MSNDGSDQSAIPLKTVHQQQQLKKSHKGNQGKVSKNNDVEDAVGTASSYDPDQIKGLD